MLRFRMFGWLRGASRSNEPTESSEDAGIVRRLVRTDAQVIGFLPGVLRASEDLSPLLLEWAATMANFVPGPIGVIAEWPSWNGAAGGAIVADEQRPRVFSLVPPICPDAANATPSLGDAVANHRRTFSRILVNLSRYAAPGHVPAAAEYVDGVVIVVPAGRMQRRRLRELAQDLDGRKNFGAVLVD